MFTQNAFICYETYQQSSSFSFCIHSKLYLGGCVQKQKYNIVSAFFCLNRSQLIIILVTLCVMHMSPRNYDLYQKRLIVIALYMFLLYQVCQLTQLEQPKTLVCREPNSSTLNTIINMSLPILASC